MNICKKLVVLPCLPISTPFFNIKLVVYNLYIGTSPQNSEYPSSQVHVDQNCTSNWPFFFTNNFHKSKYPRTQVILDNVLYIYM